MTYWRWLILVQLCLLAAACGRKGPDGQTEGLTPSIYYRPVFYTEEQKCTSKDLRDLRTDEGAIITTLCLANFKHCLMQGSCEVIDKGVRKSLGFGGRQKDGTYAFTEIDHKRCPFGYGVSNLCLDPYFSVAADPAYYSVGDVIYVPNLVGIAMPDGQIHDGYLIVRDEGGGIIGPARFDFFTGYLNYTAKANVMTGLGLSDTKNRIPFDRVFDAATVKSVKERRNYPGIPAAVLTAGLKE